MTDNRQGLTGFEARLLHELTEIDAARPAALAPSSPASARRAHRTRRSLTVVAATVVTALGGTAVASASGLFNPAPPNVQRSISGLNGHGHSVDAAGAVRIGVIDDHVAYIAPTSGGGFCLFFGSNPRSGPTGGNCIQRGAGSDEVMFGVLSGTDGGVLFGRAGTSRAQSITATFPRSGETVTAPVGDSGFFAVKIPDRSMQSLMMVVPQDPQKPVPTKDGGPIVAFQCDRVSEISVTALDGQGDAVAHGVAVGTQGCPTNPTPGPSH